jgi:hypothetical protein
MSKKNTKTNQASLVQFGMVQTKTALRNSKGRFGPFSVAEPLIDGLDYYFWDFHILRLVFPPNHYVTLFWTKFRGFSRERKMIRERREKTQGTIGSNFFLFLL